jgi:hypothetical protein
MLTDATALAQLARPGIPTLARTPAMLMGRALPERHLDDRPGVPTLARTPAMLTGRVLPERHLDDRM